MGNTLAPMQRELTLANTDPARDARESLDRLEDMAKDRIDLFYERIGNDNSDKHLIPINKVLHKYTYIGVVAEENDALTQGVTGAVGEFATGPIADALSSVATNTITKMIGSSAGRCQTTQRYAISIDTLGGISRLDYYIFTYSFSATELVKRKLSIVACCVVESSAQVEGLDTNTIRVIISRAFKGGDIPRSTLTAIYAQLVTAIHRPTDRLSLTEREQECLEDWHKPKKPTNGGCNGGTDTYSGDENRGFSQGGFQPVGVGAGA